MLKRHSTSVFTTIFFDFLMLVFSSSSTIQISSFVLILALKSPLSFISSSSFSSIRLPIFHFTSLIFFSQYTDFIFTNFHRSTYSSIFLHCALFIVPLLITAIAVTIPPIAVVILFSLLSNGHPFDILCFIYSTLFYLPTFQSNQ